MAKGERNQGVRKCDERVSWKARRRLARLTALPGPAALTACQAPLGSWLMLIDYSATPSLCAFAQPNDVYKCILLSAQIQLHSQFHFNMPPTTTTITCQLNFKGTLRKAK